MLPGIFQSTIFSPMGSMGRVNPMNKSRLSQFIRPMHPKSEIRPTAEAIQKVLNAGWVGQLKIHGHRAQIHIPADPDQEILAFNRQGQLHQKEVPDTIIQELRRIFAPATGWTVIDSEWLKPKDRVYVFDLLKLQDETLQRLPFEARWKLLPRAYISPHIQTLGVITTLDGCLDVLRETESWIEGLVFKSPSPGFEDSSIIRCRIGARRK